MPREGVCSHRASSFAGVSPHWASSSFALKLSPHRIISIVHKRSSSPLPGNQSTIFSEWRWRESFSLCWKPWVLTLLGRSRGGCSVGLLSVERIPTKTSHFGRGDFHQLEEWWKFLADLPPFIYSSFHFIAKISQLNVIAWEFKA